MRSPEPVGHGAVVVDTAGLLWVRVHAGNTAWVNYYASWSQYADIDVAEVLSEGTMA